VDREGKYKHILLSWAEDSWGGVCFNIRLGSHMLCFLRARSTLGALEGYCRPMCTKLAPGKSRANFFRTQRDLKKKTSRGGWRTFGIYKEKLLH